MNYHTNCPCCSKKVTQKTRNTPVEKNGRKFYGVSECPYCKAIFGSTYLGDSYSLVKPYFDTDPAPAEERYFDFETLSSKGIGRRHGWFNPTTGFVTQVG